MGKGKRNPDAKCSKCQETYSHPGLCIPAEPDFVDAHFNPAIIGDATGPSKFVMKDCDIQIGGGDGGFWEPLQGVRDVTIELEGTFDPKILEELGVAKCAKINDANGSQCELYNCAPGDLTWHRTGNISWRNKPIAGYRFEGPSAENLQDLEPVSETVEVEVDVRKRVDELALDIGYSALRKWLG